MRALVAVLLVLGCVGLARAEVKVINGSGDDLVLDLLSQAGQVKDVKLPAQPGPGLAIGSKSPPGQAEMMVVKSLDGAEQYRGEVTSGQIYIVHRWNPYLFTYVGEVGGQPRNYQPRVVNAAGQPVAYQVTYPDFTQSSYSLDGPDGNSTVRYGDVGQARNAGEVVDVVFTPADGGAPLSAKLKCGVVYYLHRGSGGALEVAEIGTI